MTKRKKPKNKPKSTEKNAVSLSKSRPFAKSYLLILLLLAMVICAMRLATYNEPFERDITSHSLIAQEMLSGRNLYSDLWDSKPPAIFVTYAVFNFIFGMGPLSVYMLGITAAIFTMIGIYKVGEFFGGKNAGLWAAAFWAFLCSDLWMWANQPNIEVCINACLVWVFYLFITTKEDKYQIGRYLVIGVILAIATLYKPVAIVFAAFLSFGYLCCNLNSAKKFKIAFTQICFIGIAGAIVWFAVLGYFAATSRFAIFYDTIFTYGRFYAQSRGGSLLQNIAKGFTAEKFFYRPMTNMAVPAILTFAGLAAGLFSRQRKRWILLFAFIASAPFAVALPGRFYPHYYQLWIVPLVIGAGWAVGSLYSNPEKRGTLFLSIFAGVMSLAIVMIAILAQYKNSADKWSELKYGPQFVSNKAVALELKEILQPNDKLFVWGINPEIYFWLNLRPPTGVIWATDMLEGPLAEEHGKRALADLQQARPEFVVVNIRQVQLPKTHPVVQWIMQNYKPIANRPQRGLFLILDEKG